MKKVGLGEKILGISEFILFLKMESGWRGRNCLDGVEEVVVEVLGRGLIKTSVFFFFEFRESYVIFR